MSLTPVYEIDLSDSFCSFKTIQLNEFDNTVYDTGYTYSGLTLVYDFTGFTEHFDTTGPGWPVTGTTTGHTYSNVYLNNDVYTFNGISGETHYFEIYNYFSGGTPHLGPILTGITGMTLESVLSGFSTTYSGCTELLSPITGTCCPTEALLSNLPWVYTTDHGAGPDNCEDFIQRRPVNGFTVDFVFNRNDLLFSEGGKFFYTGVRDEYDPENFVDNNLSFGFTDDGRISWQAIRYSGYCDTVSGYTPIYYVSSGQTPVLCTNGVSEDFNITICFERYYPYSGCSLPNEGGWNDLIIDDSRVVDNEYIVDLIEELNNHWRRERWKRLGKLKIYLNGRPIYELPSRMTSNLIRSNKIDHSTDWEEVIPSDRGFQPFAQAVGGGVTGCEGIHEGVCCFDIKYAAYFEDIMDFLYVRNRYLTITKPNFDIVECNEPCVDNLVTLHITDAIITDDLLYYLYTNDGIYYIKTGI